MPNRGAGKRIIVIEDDKTLNRLLCDQLERLGLEVRAGHSKADALQILGEFQPDLAILDLRLPDANGLTFLPELRKYCAVVILTAHGSIDLAVTAVKNGACEFLVKPISSQKLELALERALETTALKRDIAFWQQQAQRESRPNLVGDSPEMHDLRRLVSLFSESQSPALVCGESGVGKSNVASAIHSRSTRANGRFIVVDCDADLTASDLFGTAANPGAYGGTEPGAPTRHEGLIAAAENGSIFLNDIERLDLALQTKLLRVMETGRFRPQGGTVEQATSVRYLAASSQDLEALAQAGTFRSELFYLFSAFTIPVPPLRNRRTDIATLADHFLKARDFHRDAEKSLPPETIEALRAYDWPGNLRELRNAIERGVIMSGGNPAISPEDMALPSLKTPRESTVTPAGLSLSFDHEPTLNEIRDTYVMLLLQNHDGNRKLVAKALGMSERNTYRLLGKLLDENPGS